MPSLLDVQDAIRRGLLHDTDGGALAFISGAGLEPWQRLGIHRNTVLGTLARALTLSFPAVHRLVGADFFDGAAGVFARERPPRCADLNAYGDEFADFLQRFEPAATLPYLADVARLEWAVNRALHAPDAAALDASSLVAAVSADPARLCFTPHPSVGLLYSAFPVDTVWRAVLAQDDAALAAIDLRSGTVHLMVHRRADAVEVERLDADAWRFASLLLGGHTLAATLAAVPHADAPALLAGHLLAGHCTQFHIEDSESTP
ncbi:MAG: putative DNA-binding domain-containing protein [Burkholderiales bacterium]|nr:putative DNA-binding domain-containing protein [Burkholderiales bacterium]